MLKKYALITNLYVASSKENRSMMLFLYIFTTDT